MAFLCAFAALRRNANQPLLGRSSTPPTDVSGLGSLEPDLSR
jgi:hypothetical protein